MENIVIFMERKFYKVYGITLAILEIYFKAIS